MTFGQLPTKIIELTSIPRMTIAKCRDFDNDYSSPLRKNRLGSNHSLWNAMVTPWKKINIICEMLRKSHGISVFAVISI